MFDQYGDIFEDLKNKLVNDWNPKDYSEETGYHMDLEKYLNSVSKNRHIHRERGRTNPADLVIDDKIGIEVKKDLNNKNQVDKCLSQVKRMKKEYDYNLVLIVGTKSRDATINDLRNELKEFLGGNNPLEGGSNIDLVNKDPNSNVKKGQKKQSSDPLEGGDPFSEGDLDLGLN